MCLHYNTKIKKWSGGVWGGGEENREMRQGVGEKERKCVRKRREDRKS